jgi:hypothetical protein
MSLDVYLTCEEWVTTTPGIFIREYGRTIEISEEEWLERNPGQTPVTGFKDTNEVYSGNITHNLGAMATEAGIYEALWKPEELGITKAKQLIEPLRAGLELMKSDPERFKKFDSDNGWGTYDDFIPFVSEYLNACIDNPNSGVKVSR